MIITDPNSLVPNAKDRLNSLGEKTGSILSVEIEIVPALFSPDVARYDADCNKVFATPAAFNGEMRYLVRELGKARWNRLAPKQRLAFQMKMVQADPRVCDECEAHIKGGVPPHELHDRFGDAVGKLTAIHIANALLASTSYAAGVEFAEHPSLQDFVSGDRGFSLTPLLSVYARSELLDFCEAVTRHLLGELSNEITERSTLKAYEKLITSLM